MHAALGARSAASELILAVLMSLRLGVPLRLWKLESLYD